MKKVLSVVMISIIFIGLEKIAMGLSLIDPEDPVGEGPP